MAADPEITKVASNMSRVWASILIPVIIGLGILGLILIYLRSKIERWFNKMFFSKSEKCPKCGARLIKRNGKFGPFLGCSNYPKCNFTKN